MISLKLKTEIKDVILVDLFIFLVSASTGFALSFFLVLIGLYFLNYLESTLLRFFLIAEYSLAVERVINVLKSDLTRGSDYLKRVEVVIRGNPPLSGNTKRSLEKEFRRVRRLDKVRMICLVTEKVR